MSPNGDEPRKPRKRRRNSSNRETHPPTRQETARPGEKKSKNSATPQRNGESSDGDSRNTKSGREERWRKSHLLSGGTRAKGRNGARGEAEKLNGGGAGRGSFFPGLGWADRFGTAGRWWSGKRLCAGCCPSLPLGLPSSFPPSPSRRLESQERIASNHKNPRNARKGKEAETQHRRNRTKKTSN